MTELEKVLKVVCDTHDEAKTVAKVIGSIRRVLILKRETLEKTAISPVMIDELMLLREWSGLGSKLATPTTLLLQ